MRSASSRKKRKDNINAREKRKDKRSGKTISTRSQQMGRLVNDKYNYKDNLRNATRTLTVTS